MSTSLFVDKDNMLTCLLAYVLMSIIKLFDQLAYQVYVSASLRVDEFFVDD